MIHGPIENPMPPALHLAEVVINGPSCAWDGGFHLPYAADPTKPEAGNYGPNVIDPVRRCRCIRHFGFGDQLTASSGLTMVRIQIKADADTPEFLRNRNVVIRCKRLLDCKKHRSPMGKSACDNGEKTRVRFECATADTLGGGNYVGIAKDRVDLPAIEMAGVHDGQVARSGQRSHTEQSLKTTQRRGRVPRENERSFHKVWPKCVDHRNRDLGAVIREITVCRDIRLFAFEGGVGAVRVRA